MNVIVGLSVFNSDAYNILNIPVLKICISRWRHIKYSLGIYTLSYVYIFKVRIKTSKHFLKCKQVDRFTNQAAFLEVNWPSKK